MSMSWYEATLVRSQMDVATLVLPSERPREPFSPGLLGFLPTNHFPPGAFAQDVLQAVEGMVAVLHPGEFACGSRLLRPLRVLQLEGEDVEPGGEPDFVVLKVFAGNLGPRLYRNLIPHERQSIGL